jgi:hypothetical protein
VESIDDVIILDFQEKITLEKLNQTFNQELIPIFIFNLFFTFL